MSIELFTDCGKQNGCIPFVPQIETIKTSRHTICKDQSNEVNLWVSAVLVVGVF